MQYLARKAKLNQRGETLIEVTIALIIIGLVLLSAYVLTTRAFQLGQSAKERSQAAQLLQKQAEGLRSIRDQSSTWDAFRIRFQCQGGTIDCDDFHVEKDAATNTWKLVNGNFNPGSSSIDIDDSLPDFYTITAYLQGGNFIQNPYVVGDYDKMEAVFTITWPRIGGGPDETSTIYMKLANRNLPSISE